MRKIIIFTSILFIAAIAVAGLYFSKLSLETRTSDKVLSFIPQDAAIVLEFRNDKSFQDIFQDYGLFKAIIGNSRSAEISSLQALQNQLQSTSVPEGVNTFVSLHYTKEQVELLWLMPMGKEQDKDALYDALLNQPSGYKAKKLNISGKQCIELKIDSLQRPFFLCLENGAILGSFSSAALQQALNPKSRKISAQFIEEITKANQHSENSLLNLFINHSAMPAFLSKFLNGNLSGNSALLHGLNGYSALSMNFKSDALMFNGIASTNSATGNYFDLLRFQKPVNSTVLKAFPASTANYLAFGISDYKRFDANLDKLLDARKELKKLKNQFAIVKAMSGISVDNDIKRFLSDEFAIVQLADQQKLAIVKLTNGMRMTNVLDLISQQRTEEIFELNNANIFYYCYGDPMRNFARPYYTIIDNYLILANSISTLQQFLSDYNNGRRLTKTPDFVQFNQFIANQSTISFFANIKNSGRIISSVLKRPFANNFKDASFGLDKFYGLSYQWSADGGQFFTNMYASIADTSAVQPITDDGL